MPNQTPPRQVAFRVSPAANEHGAVLFVSMILLIVLTLMGITALRVSAIEEKMSGNVRDRAIAFQAAEAALRAADKTLADSIEGASGIDLTAEGVFTGTACTKGVFKLVAGVPYFSANAKGDGSDTSFWLTWPWDSSNCYYTNNIELTDFSKIGKPIETPRYVIEEIPPQDTEGTAYRVTAIGYGTSKASQVILQATYASE